MSMIRTRWAAIGAAVAVTLGGGGLFVANAADSTSDSLFHPVTPVRVMDTRVGGTAVVNTTVKLDLEGTIATYNADGSTTNTEVVPDSATSVAINLTVTGGLKNGDYGFVTAFPCTAVTDTPPTASSLNFENRVDIANALNVTTSSSGEVCFNVYGTAHLIVDVAGYYDDSRIDAIETDISANDSRIDAIETDISAIEGDYLDNDAPLTMTYPGSSFIDEPGGSVIVENGRGWGNFTTGTGTVGINLHYPSSMGQALTRYQLSSFSICWPDTAATNGGYISDVKVYTNDSTDLYNFTATTTADFVFAESGCKTYEIPSASREGGTAYYIQLSILDSNGATAPTLTVSHVNATYSPYSVVLNFPLIPLVPFEN